MICRSQLGCFNSKITNVCTIIATDYFATNVYGKIYCKDKIKNTSNVTSYYSVCSLLSLPTTLISPETISTDYLMRNQTMSLIDSELEKIVEILNNDSITNIISLLLIAVSVKMRLLHKEAIRKHTKLLNRIIKRDDDFETSLLDIYNVDNNDNDASDDSDDNYYSNDNKNTKNNNNSKYVNYIIGFGKRANHLAIIFVFIEIYDVYTDISHLIGLIVKEYHFQFEIFLASIIVTIFIDIIIALFWLKYELKIMQNLRIGFMKKVV